MSKKELLNAYFAGLIDGEGTVDIYPYKQGTKLRSIIKVDMTCEKTIMALHAHFGGYCAVKKTDPKNKPQWRWEVTFAKAKEVAKTIRPYLITKASGADEIIAHVPNKRGRPCKIRPKVV